MTTPWHHKSKDDLQMNYERKKEQDMKKEAKNTTLEYDGFPICSSNDYLTIWLKRPRVLDFFSSWKMIVMSLCCKQDVAHSADRSLFYKKLLVRICRLNFVKVKKAMIPALKS